MASPIQALVRWHGSTWHSQSVGSMLGFPLEDLCGTFREHSIKRGAKRKV